MDCREFERLIADYIDRKMDYQTLRQFNEHMESCPDCKEELTIQFLVTEGIQRLEDGSAFDLQGELNQRQEETLRKLKNQSRISGVGFACEIAAIGVILGIVVYIIL